MPFSSNHYEARISPLAQQSGIREALAWFLRERQWINDRHLAVCRIPAPTFLESKRAEWMRQQLQELGWEAEMDAGGNVLAFAGRRKREPLLAVTAHLDTVLAPLRPDDISVDSDGTMRGPGVADNGAGLAALLALARVLRETDALGESLSRIVLIANVGEEGEGNLGGMRYLCGASPLAQRLGTFLVLDGPALEQVTNHALASRRYEISFTGPGGHSWSDFGAGNPVHALCRAISTFEAAHRGATRDPFPRNNSTASPPEPAHAESSTAESSNGWREDVKSSFNFGLIEGGASVNSIPSQALAKLDLRSEDERMLEQMVNTLTSAVARSLERENRLSNGAKVAARIKEIGYRPGGRLEDSAPLMQAVMAVDGWLGIRSRPDCSSTDANIPLSLGLPAISIGAGGSGGGAHTTAEWYRPQGRELGLRRLVLLLATLLDAGSAERRA